MVQGSLLVVQAARLGRSQRVQRETVHLAAACRTVDYCVFQDSKETPRCLF